MCSKWWLGRPPFCAGCLAQKLRVQLRVQLRGRLRGQLRGWLRGHPFVGRCTPPSLGRIWQDARAIVCAMPGAQLKPWQRQSAQSAGSHALSRERSRRAPWGMHFVHNHSGKRQTQQNKKPSRNLCWKLAGGKCEIMSCAARFRKICKQVVDRGGAGADN